MSQTVRVLHHDNCFDGIASSAVFSAFYRLAVDSSAVFEYKGLAHQEVNAIVDFKYSSSGRLTWWFDHHQSAFLSTEDETHFRSDRSGRKFHDPNYRSCTKFIAHISETIFNTPLDHLNELIEWADIIDGAQFKDAQSAVELKEPALRLMLVIESVRSPALIHDIIRRLQTDSLEQVSAQPRVKELFDGLYEQHVKSIEILRDKMRCSGGVVEFDISDTNITGHNKFIPYHVFPDSLYTVGVSLEPSRAKVSVGTNPWTQDALHHNLAEICERYGGGGHAVVAAISFEPDELVEARRVAREIAETLRHDPY
jgi:hypothetical protein